MGGEGDGVREVRDGDELIALVIPSGYSASGIRFFTPNSFSQQLAVMAHPAGHVIPPHVHKPVPREVHYTREVLFIRSGRVRVDLYGQDRRPLGSEILRTGDVILLAAGGHGFTMLEPTDMVEVKQGPYAGTEDKERL